MNWIFESKNFYTLAQNILAFIVVVLLLWTIIFPEGGVFLQESKIGTWDLSSTSGREVASMEKPISPYTVKKCGEIKHTDGDVMTFCVATFNGTSGGFYDANKNLMVVGSFSAYTLVHEIFHAASIHNYNKGFTDMLSAKTQERMAYDAENLYMQIEAFQEDLNITPDLSDEKKSKLGIPTNKVFASGQLATTSFRVDTNVKNSAKKNTNLKKV